MTYGGATIIIAGLLLGLLGWAAAAYSSHQVRQHKAAMLNDAAAKRTDSVRVVSIDVTGDFTMTARHTEHRDTGAWPPEMSKRRDPVSVAADRYSVPSSIIIPRDPETRKILTIDELPVRDVEQQLAPPTIEIRA